MTGPPYPIPLEPLPGFWMVLGQGVSLEEACEDHLVLTYGVGKRTRLTYRMTSLSDLLMELCSGISLARLATQHEALDVCGQIALRELLGALNQRRLLALAWPDTEHPALRISTAAGWPDCQRRHLPGDVCIQLSALAAVHRIDDEMVLDYPPRGLRLGLLDPLITGWLLSFCSPGLLADHIGEAVACGRSESDVRCLIEMLVAWGILAPTPANRDDDREILALWECHALHFYTESHSGYNWGQLGTVPGASTRRPSPPLNRPRPSLARISLPVPQTNVDSGILAALSERRSVRYFAADRPVPLAVLSTFFQATVAIQGTDSIEFPGTGEGQSMDIAYGPSPSAGACHALEIHLCVGGGQVLPPGIYHYDAIAHQLCKIATAEVSDALRQGAAGSMGHHQPPPLAIVITAHFERVFWKYRGIAMANVLRDVGALYQTLYLGAQALGLRGCAIGNVDVAAFERINGMPFWREGAVGMFAFGYPAPSTGEC